MHGPYLKQTSTTIFTEICTACEQHTVNDLQQHKPEVGFHACFNFSRLHSGSPFLYSGNRPSPTEYINLMFVEHLGSFKGSWYVATNKHIYIFIYLFIYTHTHTSAIQSRQCESGSRLAPVNHNCTSSEPVQYSPCSCILKLL